MKIDYRVRERGVEIVRCVGADSCVYLPGQIRGIPVTGIAAYAFSDRKEKEDEDVCEYISGSGILSGDTEVPQTGTKIECVEFPDSLEAIGDYAFYGCKNLQVLKFSNRLLQIGRGAFTGCSGLGQLHVRMLKGEKSCVKEILGELWQRIDVAFSYEDQRDAYFVFPEHYEEAVENTPARILFTQHHGSGNHYRQCFYDKELDCDKYDALFSVAKAQDKIQVLSDLVFGRLCYPRGLTQTACIRYENFVRERQREVAGYLVSADRIEALAQFGKRKLWTREGIDAALEAASEYKRKEAMSILMEEKHRFFPARKKKFVL